MRKFVIFSTAVLLFGFSFSISAASKFGCKVTDTDAFLYSEGNIYIAQSESIATAGYYACFAAQDFSNNKELLVKKMKKADILLDTEDRKVVKAVFTVGDEAIDPNYELVLYLQVRKGFPQLVVDSQLKYLGSASHTLGINWGFESAHSPLKYYTIPGKKRKYDTGRLIETRKSKIGQANWLFANTGDGTGIGVIAPTVLLGKGKSFVFMNAVPKPKKKLKAGESLDISFMFMPIKKGEFNELPGLFQKIKGVSWEY